MTSKEILDRAGISRATLNNYISWGLLPKPEVRRPEAGSSRARRLGYFPESALERIQEISRLKKSGIRMEAIIESKGLPSLQSPPRRTLPAHPAPFSNSDLTQGAAVLAGRLVDEDRLAAELPPDEFAELAAEFFSISAVIPGDGPALLDAVRTIEDSVSRLDEDWRQRKNWLNSLRSCLVLDGAQSSNESPAFTISTLLNRPGIWATKNFLVGIGADLLERLSYGIEWTVPTGRHRVLESYARLQELVDAPVPWPAPYHAFETTPVAQIFELR